MGGLIAWKSVRQERTSLSSCEAEIQATNEGAKRTIAVCHFSDGMSQNGFPVFDSDGTTDLYNDNESCVHWSHAMTSKAICHMEL